MQDSRLEKSKKVMFIFLFVSIVGLQIKYIFMELNIDTEYAIAMSWRMLKGDEMFKTMFEPHQTSAFFMAILMKIYVAVHGGNEGIVLFLNFAGVCIHGMISMLLYRFLKKKIEPDMAKLLCMFFMVLHPKGYVTPEFSNMLLWFSTLLFITFCKYLEHYKKGYLICSGIFLCLLCISYPSCIIVCFFMVLLLFCYSKNFWKDTMIFTGVCMILGGMYLGYFMMKLGLEAFIAGIHKMLSGDMFHGSGQGIYGGIFTESTFKALVWLIVNYCIAYIAAKCYCTFQHRKNRKEVNEAVLRFGIFTVLAAGSDIIRAISLTQYVYDITWFHLFYPVFILYFAKGIMDLNGYEKKLVSAAYAISAGVLLAVVMLSNLSITFSLQYAIPAIVLSFIPAKSWLEKRGKTKKSYIYFIYGLIFFNVMFKGFLEVREIGGIVKAGPAKGIITEYMNAYKNNRMVEDWAEYVEAGDSVLIVGENSINALGYLLGDTEVSIHSTMCGPTYNEVLLQYWTDNPEKYPDVIAVECWYGDLKVSTDSWIMQWLQSEYQPSGFEDGYYYRFYRLEQ